MNVLAFDPGLCTGVAYIGKDRIECGILEDETWGHWFQLANGSAAVVYVERPVIYPTPRTKVNPNDLITLALRAGELAGHCEQTPVRYVTPAEWKRQLPKDICNARVRNMLTNAELDQIKNVFELPQSKRHNALDALGIALWAKGRKVF